jgi:hypothetical protein
VKETACEGLSCKALTGIRSTQHIQPSKEQLRQGP